MLNCKENSELLSQALDRTVTLRERLAMRLHLMMCRGCRNFEKQLTFLRRAAQEWRQRP
jgi:predicted anti-sigma-YlaC factor YlaD